MKITIIRHGKVDMKWPKKCTSAGFDEACARYNEAPIVKIEKTSLENGADVIYVSSLSRSKETARSLFGNREFVELPEISEVPLRSFKDTKKSYPLWVWNVLGRGQWLFKNKRTEEDITATRMRANKAIDICEAEGKDCILVTHGFFMKTLLKEMKKRGYSLRGSKRIQFNNLQSVIAEK
jgi:broad specificity phosphatase PhoE